MNREPFRGFPTRSRLTPVPDLFFSRLLAEIDSLPELKVVLHVFWRLYRKQGALKFITCEELTSDKTLVEGLDGTEVLRGALDSAVSHGILLHVVLGGEGGARDAYSINSEANRAAVAKIQSGELSAHVMPQPQSHTREEPANVFALYEQNIGLLTPMIAEELKEAEKLYPALWIEEAFREAVSLNKRNWRYIARILERWSLEGKGSGESGRDSRKERGPSRYLRGRYGHLVRH
ncbi:MAG: DnaD domain protein [Chloroflexi bacterium]|nr:DnaD domain protein [Chloroflexota bacterium]